MRGGGLYWVVAAGSAPTDLLGAGVLSTAAALQDAVLVTLGRGAEPMLSLLADDHGPARLRLFQRSHHGMQQALRGLPEDLPRVASAATGLSLV